MEVYGGDVRIAPLILNLSTYMEVSVVTYTPRLLYFRGKISPVSGLR